LSELKAEEVVPIRSQIATLKMGKLDARCRIALIAKRKWPPLCCWERQSAAHTNKGRVVRGLCCSESGVFKPDERGTRRRLSNGSCYVNAKADCCSETNPSKFFVAYAPDEIFAPTHSYAIEPCKCHGRD